MLPKQFFLTVMKIFYYIYKFKYLLITYKISQYNKRDRTDKKTK